MLQNAYSVTFLAYPIEIIRIRILYTSVGLGRYRAPLSSVADNSFGGAIGYQMFSVDTRKQLILESGGRYTSDDFGQRALGAAARSQVAFGRRGIFRLDNYILFGNGQRIGETSVDFEFGGRLELLYRF